MVFFFINLVQDVNVLNGGYVCCGVSKDAGYVLDLKWPPNPNIVSFWQDNSGQF